MIDYYEPPTYAIIIKLAQWRNDRPCRPSTSEGRRFLAGGGAPKFHLSDSRREKIIRSIKNADPTTSDGQKIVGVCNNPDLATADGQKRSRAKKKGRQEKWDWEFTRAREEAPNRPQGAQNFRQQGAPMVKFNVTPLSLPLAGTSPQQSFKVSFKVLAHRFTI